ncbi:RNA polymerase sigma factor, sigma-70 family [Desulfitobacterium dehalogenans ATCC 51507]|uniref:RNA polymerase sigma factor, sigma-70 family n=1 Tax=Desulfitobacterium dehalogenans (strain ATCC 51507 / DSM 9161 / JW/IU-DC1) TaxID=756499 RepID=I4A9N7_DESDJ|nr:sigma-70 family RNA polymerase sigma factor [Desulfitobacterium dehalogenans]AFM00672.1 RNA polymerase sigma factor, sigma-70 family [Desulfitobacterium dehalogenans ATCC 51507]
MEKQSLRTDDCEEKIIKQYSDLVYRLAFARMGTRHDADEIFQEVFLRFIKKKPVFHEEEHRKAWFIRVTINCSKSFWSSSWFKNAQPIDDDIAFETKENMDLYHELQKLPPKYRGVIHLFYYEDMSIEEIGKVLNRKNSTVRTQLTRARAALKAVIKEDDYV